MLPTKLNPLGVSPYDGVMEFEKAGNLYEKIQYKTSFTTITEETDEYIEVTDYVDGTVNHNGRCVYIDSVYLNPDTTYSFSIDIQNIVVEDENVLGIGVGFYYPNTKYGYFCTTKESIYGGYDKSLERRTITGTFTTKSDLTENMPCRIIVRIGFNSPNGVPLTKDVVFRVYKNTAMVVKGETIPTVYESYNNLYRCYGESTQYQNDGRNLLPLPDGEVVFDRGEGQYMSWTINNNRIKMFGDVRQDTGYSSVFKLTNGYVAQFYTSNAIKEYFLPAGTYTISIQNWSGYTSSNAYPYLRLVNTAGTMYQVAWNNEKGYTFTSEEPIAFAYLFANKIEIDCEFGIQIEAGSTMKEWKPYTTNPTPTVNNPSPIVSKYPRGRYKTNLPGITIKLDDDLRSVPCGVADYIEVDMSTKEKKIVRQIFKAITSGNDSYYNYAEYGATCYRLYHSQYGTTQWAYNNDNNINTLCSHLLPYTGSVMWANRENANFSGHEARGQVFTFKDPSFIDDNAFKQFLSKDVEVHFALAEPTITLL